MYIFINTRQTPTPDGPIIMATTSHRGRSVAAMDTSDLAAARRCASCFFFGEAADRKKIVLVKIRARKYMARLKTPQETFTAP